MGYEVGQRVRIAVDVKDINGNLAAATMALVVLREDGTAYAGLTIVHDSTGKYHSDVTVDTPGRITWQWNATGAVIGVYYGQAYVRSPFAGILSLTEAKVHLNKSLTDTSDDDELLDWIDAITIALEKIEIGRAHV